jgi:hypothetical protein
MHRFLNAIYITPPFSLFPLILFTYRQNLIHSDRHIRNRIEKPVHSVHRPRQTAAAVVFNRSKRHGRRHNVVNAQKLPKTAFQKGCAPGPGRPPGMRNRLTEVALAALGDDFSVHGAAVIEEVRKTKPHVYLQVVASLLPKQVQTEKFSPLIDLSDAELAELEVHLTATRARLVKKLERHNCAAIEPSDSQEK